MELVRLHPLTDCEHELSMRSRPHDGNSKVRSPCGLREFHVYNAIWTSVIGEEVCTIYNSDDAHDCFAIAARKQLSAQLLDTFLRKFQGSHVYVVVWCYCVGESHGHSSWRIPFSSGRP